MKQEKSKGELLAEKLTHQPKHAGLLMSDSQLKKAMAFNEGYKTYLDQSKIEREAVSTTLDMLKKQGYVEFQVGTKYSAGDKVYLNNRGKALIFAVMGKAPLEEGVHIIASHVDSPRVDLKQNPLYEESELAFFKTHYYGGIRKYQWVTIPLALHGLIALADGTHLPISLGEKEGEPVFFMTDILPHLSKEQDQRKLGEGIRGEELNVLVGSLPFKDDKVSEKIKLNILNLLNEKYGLIESDFRCADLSLVPAAKSMDVGFDRGAVGAYGHDDRVCAYTSIMASLEVDTPEKTWINILADREEIGSDGNTGLNSRMLDYFVADLGEPYGLPARTIFKKSKCLSADVAVALDPTFPDVTDPRNTGKFGYGTTICKYTGARGKSGTSEASAEFTGWISRLLTDNKVIWQTGTLGKVDQGGGGTVAMFIANLGVDVIDIGVSVLAMHAPIELVSKLDVYQTYKAFVAFLSAQ